MNQLCRKLWTSYKNKNISEQIFLAMIGVTVLVVLILVMSIFIFSSRSMEKEYQTAHQYNLEVTNNIMEIQVSYAVEMARDLLNNDGFKRSVMEETSKGGYFTGANLLYATKILTGITSSANYIQEMMVVNENGNILYVTKYQTTSGEFSHFYKDREMLSQDWVAAAREAKGKELFYADNLLIDDDTTFSMVKHMINPQTGDSIGYLVMNLKKNLLNKAFADESKAYNTYRYLLLDTNQDRYRGDIAVVYCNASTEEEQQIKDSYLNGENGKYVFNTIKNPITGWLLVSVIERGELFETSAYLGGVIMIMLCIVCVGYILLSRLISRAICKPLSLLDDTIHQVAEGNRKVTVEFDQSEVGKIGQQFKNLVNNNLELRDHLLKTQLNEREAELLLLQSQINPHFLYNVLDSIYMQAIINDDDEVASMIQLLSETFHLSLNNGEKLVSVRDAIKNIESYMKIQGIRFFDRFTLHIDVAEEMMEEKILTFLLQPIVENSFYHGLEPKVGKGSIWIKGWEEDEKLFFQIKDDGVGIEDMSTINEGYGISNITERIKIYYGEAYGVTFSSQRNVGTCVEMVLPKGERKVL